MLFLKVTRSVSGFLKKSGWLVAELVLVFLGMYGAFLLERMHDEEMDLLRKKQILQALVDEFENYEEELSSASSSLDEGYGIPFFTSYSSGEKPFPSPIPFGGMGSVNTGIWEAMLQSGGIEVLEVEMIQEVQGFFKKLQDLLDLYSRFERLSENLILPMMDESVDFFYEPEGSELRNKYKWYVNSLFTVGMSLRELSAQAGKTKNLLYNEYEKTITNAKEKHGEVEEEDPSASNESQEPQETQSEPLAKPSEVNDGQPNLLSQDSQNALAQILNTLAEASEKFDENYAVPFFTSYSNGECPEPFIFDFPNLSADLINSCQDLFREIKDNSYSAGKIHSQQLQEYLTTVIEYYASLNAFEEKTVSHFQAAEDLLFYEENSSELREEFGWFANEFYSLGTHLRSISEKSSEILAQMPD